LRLAQQEAGADIESIQPRPAAFPDAHP